MRVWLPRRRDRHMDIKRGKARDSVRATTPIPNWMMDETFPLLTSDEVKVLNYVIRRTWGIGRRRARISIAQISEGTLWEGDWIDHGTGLIYRRVRVALDEMFRFGVIIKTADYSRARNLPLEVKPGWRNVVDIRGLKQRYLVKLEKGLKAAGNWGIGIGEGARLPEHILSIPDVSRSYSYQSFLRNYVDGNYEAEADFDITIDDAEDDVSEDGMGQTVMRQDIKDRVARFMIPDAVKAAGIEPGKFVEMKNFLLDLSGKRAVADSNVVPYSDQVLGAATDAATLAVICGLTSIEMLDKLPAYWKNDWRYAQQAANNRDTTPTLKQLADIMPGYATFRLAPPPEPLRVYQGKRPDEEGFVSSELDDWQP